MRVIVALFIILLLFNTTALAFNMKISRVRNGENIPKKYTCDSLDISPAIRWGDVPPYTESFAIICIDPDAPGRIWTHWVIFNIPADTGRLEENTAKVNILPGGITQGVNDFGSYGYRGPCPPPGKSHRYVFTIYALDTKLSLGHNPTREKLLNAMRGHILSEARVIGTYKR